jgi:hypothetical protein
MLARHVLLGTSHQLGWNAQFASPAPTLIQVLARAQSVPLADFSATSRLQLLYTIRPMTALYVYREGICPTKRFLHQPTRHRLNA